MHGLAHTHSELSWDSLAHLAQLGFSASWRPKGWLTFQGGIAPVREGPHWSSDRKDKQGEVTLCIKVKQNVAQLPLSNASFLLSRETRLLLWQNKIATLDNPGGAVRGADDYVHLDLREIWPGVSSTWVATETVLRDEVTWGESRLCEEEPRMSPAEFQHWEGLLRDQSGKGRTVRLHERRVQRGRRKIWTVGHFGWPDMSVLRKKRVVSCIKCHGEIK